MIQMKCVKDNDLYQNEDGSLVMKRPEGVRGLWELFKDGELIDRDKYRHDLSERHNLLLY